MQNQLKRLSESSVIKYLALLSENLELDRAGADWFIS